MTSSLLDHVLAIVAIIAAIYTIYLERSLHGRLMSQQKNIEDLVLTSYEKYLGPFPADMDEATSLISSVQEPKELLIMVDFFGYGHYSRPEKFEKYLKALIEAKSTVQMLVYAEKSAIKALRKQFPEDYFETLKARDSFKDYVKFYKGVLPFRPDTYQEFVNGIVTTQDSLWRDLAKAQRVEVRAVEVDSVDEAVFFLDDTWRRNGVLLLQCLFRARGILFQNPERTVHENLP